MATSSKSELKKTDFLKLGNSAGEISKVVSPNSLQVGLSDPDFTSNLSVKGTITAELGITGSITQVADGVDYIQAGSNISVTKNSNGSLTIDAFGFTNNRLTFGNGLDPYNSSYDGSTVVTLNVAEVANGGIDSGASGLKIDPSNLTQKATPTGADRVIIGDAAASNTVKYADITDVLAIGTSTVLSNVLALSDGIKAAGGLTQYNNSQQVTISVNKRSSNSGLGFDAGALFVDPSAATDITSVDAAADYLLIYDSNLSATRRVLVQDINAQLSPASLTIGDGLQDGGGSTGTTYNGSSPVTVSAKAANATINTSAAGIAVLKVPNQLSDGAGISTFSFDGSGAGTVSVDQNPAGGLNFDGSSRLQLDVNNLAAGVSPQLPYEIAVAYGSNDTQKVELGSVRNLFLTNHISNTVWVDGGLKAKTTSSISIDSDNRYADGVGMDDAFLFVSGTIGSRGTGNRGTAVFGGDVYSSGSIITPAFSGSLTRLPDGSSYLIAGSNVTITSASNGSITIAATGGGGGGGSVDFYSGSTSVSSVSAVNTSHLGVIQDLGGGSIAITGSIGNAEDGLYTDGLFTDFNSNTPIGTAIDRFNEVLKGLAPSAAPNLDDINSADSGTNARLSFGTSHVIAEYANVEPSTLTPASALSDADINASYTSTSAGNDLRVAVFKKDQTINGTLNADVSADGSNYPDYAFGDGNLGELKLYVNDNTTPIRTVDLTTFGSGDSLNGNGSGFVDVSESMPGHFADGSNFETFQHRTGSWQVVHAEQRNGWNWARVVHTVGSVDKTTNYVEWVNDVSGSTNDITAAGSALDSLAMSGDRRLSGARYHTAGSAEYRVRASNAYRNVYSTNNITFTGTRCSVGSQSFPTIDYAGGEDETKVLHITGSATINTDPILNQSISVAVNVPHPLKSNLSNAGSESIPGILLYNLSNTSTVTSETFRAENYRLISGSYGAQSDVTDSGNTWDSSLHMSGSNAGHEDGLLFYNSRLYAPNQGAVSGDFRSTSDGGSITNGPANNVDYSGITSGTRTFYRYFQNNSGGSKSNFSLTINGSGTIVNQSTALNTTNIHVLLKLPTTTTSFETGWMDLAVAFATGQTQNGAGCLNGALDSSLNATNNGTFGTQSAGSNEYIMVKIEADASWTGYISQMSLTWT